LLKRPKIVLCITRIFYDILTDKDLLHTNI
jgi:hypothetical protein